MLEKQNFTRTITIVEASRANAWLKSGLNAFVKQRKTWMLMMLCLTAFGFLSMSLSIFGMLALKILTPVFLAGLMKSCLLLEQNEPFSVSRLFDGFQNRFAALSRIGLLYTCWYLISALLLSLFFVTNAGPLFVESLEKLTKVLAEGGAPDLTMLVPPPTSLLIKSAILWIFLSVPGWMILCFSPLLTRLYDVEVHASIRLSVVAVWRNRAAFLTLALSLLFLVTVLLSPIVVLIFIAQLLSTSLPSLIMIMVFFIFMLVIRPILMASIYAAHRDIFTAEKSDKSVLAA